MDQVDKNILHHLQEDGRISMTELGRRVGLSVPAVKERVKRLEENGTILGYRAILNPKKVNKHVLAFILFDSKRCKEFREFCIEHPMVVECHRLAGQYSYLVKVLADSVENLEDFIDDSMIYGHPSTLINLSSPVEFKHIT
ncbi:Lrp/AsnC family transcriptional regulator [Mesobacillus subterraneus]|uniref:Lrp/AsnC family transcriptional regulator n=1 Tax=Mesobacillus subterraneus TaxID=285983 RepID=UPI00203F97EE|nr:Lrp/AsnC family transcriptional regulator [Mesobacillus subterraneus]MCM3665202.1 Lrp/AsnC family transcriptional regulator [Mesobacillus subterraneus]MCM3684215.1 Lrp/AsnC family transcriptional regulator [Mesobacillus subterraneus]